MRIATLSRVGVFGALLFATAFGGDAISAAMTLRDGTTMPSAGRPRMIGSAVSPSARLVDPLPLLHGSTLKERARLRLIVADAPPYILDVDRHSVQRFAGVARAHRDGIAVSPFRGGALATIFPLCPKCPYRERFLALKADGSASPVPRRLRLAAERKPG